MINKISALNVKGQYFNLKNTNAKECSPKEKASNVVSFKGNPLSADKMALYYRAGLNIKHSSTVPFTGSRGIFDSFSESVKTCKDATHNGEEVGKRLDITGAVMAYQNKLTEYDDAIKTTGTALEEKGEDGKVAFITDSRKQIKKDTGHNFIYEIVVRPPRKVSMLPHRTNVIQQALNFELEPSRIVYDKNNRRQMTGTPENVYALNTKGKYMAVIEDGDNVLLTNAGKIEKKDNSDGKLQVVAKQYELKGKDGNKLNSAQLAAIDFSDEKHSDYNNKVQVIKNVFNPFKVNDVPVVREKTGGSEGGGTEIVIGLQEGRFVPEIIDSIETFCKKVQNGEIVLDKFVPAENAQNIQVLMLAGGFGSRAEYSNAAASKIFHGKKNGSDATKGCHRTATGLTPMETTFISLHKAGLLDCSKENLEIGKNIKFYLNDSNKNTGNGGFTIDAYNTMERDNRKSIMIFPNDAMSRIPNAISKMADLINSGNAAMVMVAKEVDKEDARGSLGIMKINDNGEIEAFAEKPKTFEEGYVVDDKCFANTFQFSISKEAFSALEKLAPYLPAEALGRESRDWSKVLTPVLMGITQNDNLKDMQKQIDKAMQKEFGNNIESIPLNILEEAKNILKDQKIYAVKTNEPWADCGTLNALYHTTMEIASGDFPLEDFERKHVLDSVNTETGLITSTPEQKEEIEKKYNIKGQVMVVPKAKNVSKSIINNYDYAITRFSASHK